VKVQLVLISCGNKGSDETASSVHSINLTPKKTFFSEMTSLSLHVNFAIREHLPRFSVPVQWIRYFQLRLWLLAPMPSNSTESPACHISILPNDAFRQDKLEKWGVEKNNFFYCFGW